MTTGARTLVYPVQDLERAKSLFVTLLGAEPAVDQPYYVGFQVGAQHVGLNPRGGAQGASGVLAYWHVDDIHGHVKALVDSGASVLQPVSDVGGGRLIATIQDMEGNAIGLLQEP